MKEDEYPAVVARTVARLKRRHVAEEETHYCWVQPRNFQVLRISVSSIRFYFWVFAQ